MDAMGNGLKPPVFSPRFFEICIGDFCASDWFEECGAGVRDAMQMDCKLLSTSQ